MDIARVSVKGQVTVPVEIRTKLGLKEGGKVVFMERGGAIILVNADRLALEESQQGMSLVVEHANPDETKTRQQAKDAHQRSTALQEIRELLSGVDHSDVDIDQLQAERRAKRYGCVD